MCESIKWTFWHLMFPQHFAAHWLTPLNIFLQELMVSQLIKKLSALSGSEMFITVFTTVHHSTVSWASWIFCMPSHIFKTYFNIIAAATPVCSEDFFFPPSYFHIKILNVFFIIPSDLITLIIFDTPVRLIMSGAIPPLPIVALIIWMWLTLCQYL